MGTTRPAPPGDILNWEHDFTARAKKCLMQAGTAIFGKVYVTDGTDDLVVETDGSINTNATLQAGTAIAGKVYVTDGTDDAQVVENTDDTTNLDGLNGLVSDSVLYGRIDADTVKPLRIDGSTHSIQTIGYEHHEIHGNSHYFVEDFTTLGSAATLDFCLTPDASAKWVHLTFKYTSTLLMTLNMYEGADVDADGLLVVPHANNRALTFSGTHTGAADQATVMTDSTATFTVDALIGWKIYNITDGSYGVVTDNDGTTVTVAALLGGTGNDWDAADQYEINRSLTVLESDCTVNAVGIRLGGSSSGSGTNPR